MGLRAFWIRLVQVPKVLRLNEVDDSLTYLHIAARAGQTNMFKSLIDFEEDKNPVDNIGITPLRLAVKNGHYEIAKFIIQNSVKYNIDLNVCSEDWCPTSYIMNENGRKKSIRV